MHELISFFFFFFRLSTWDESTPTVSNLCIHHKERASLIAQLVKNLPAMQETPVQILGWEDTLQKE